MNRPPPRWLELIVSLLIPPASREYVLGDLHERHVQSGQSWLLYLLRALQTVPFLIWSQIRRQTDWRVLTAQALTTFSCLMGATYQFLGNRAPLFFGQQRGLLLLAGLTAIVTVFLALFETYVEKPGAIALLRDALAYAIGLGADWFLHGLAPQWAVPFAVALLGSISALLAGYFVRTMLNLNHKAPPLAPSSAAELYQLARQFQKRIRRRNLREYLAAGIAGAAFTYFFFVAPNPVLRVSSALTVTGTIYMAAQLYRKGTPQQLPSSANAAEWLQFHHSELERQRDLLRRVWSWYLLPLSAGPALLISATLFSKPESPGPFAFGIAFAVFCLAIAVVNQRRARQLDQDLEALARFGGGL